MSDFDMPDLSRLATKLALSAKREEQELRFGVVSAVATTVFPQTCSVTIQGEAVAIAGVRFIGSYRARVTDTVVMIKSGGDLFIVGGLTTQSIPAGMILPYASSASASGFLACDGASYLRTDQVGLFNAIGTTWGSVDGTHFNVPNFLGRTLIGAGSAGSGGLTARTIGTSGGTETHQLTTAQLASHSHVITNTKYRSATTAHAHANQGGYVAEAADVPNGLSSPSPVTDTAGSDNSHPIMQPWAAVNYIIKT